MPATPFPATGLAIYIDELHGALDDKTKHALDLAQPSLVVLAGGPDGLAANAPKLAAEVRSHVAGVRMSVNIGCDTWSARLVAGACTLDQAAAKLASGADTCVAIAGEMPIFDPEGGEMGSAAHPTCAPLATEVLRRVRAAHPELVIAHSAYDVPAQVTWKDAAGKAHGFGGNMDYPWKEWCGPGGADVDIPQVYFGAADTAPPCGVDGGLWRLQRHLDSWATMMAQGLIARAAAQAVYVQLHGATPAAIIAVAEQYPLRIGWASPGELDDAGLAALQGLCLLERKGQRVRDFQAAAGLTVDGIAGPETLAALGVAS